MAEGSVVAGRYRVDRVLGEGGMGLVVAATDLPLRRPIALKVMLPVLAADERAVRRFLREARATVRLKGDHSVRVFDVGELPSGVPYMAMELLVGRDLETIVSERGRLPFAEAVGLILQAMEGVAEAHAVGIVHRDLKPANMFLTRRPDGTPLLKVLDFGLAKAPSETDETKLTRASTVVGTRAYMAPEQRLGSVDVDVRADIWALGVCLYELLTGKMPFRGPSALELHRPFDRAGSGMMLLDAPKPPHVLVPEIPTGLSFAVMRCIERDANHRFSNVAELAMALEPHASADARGIGAKLGRMLEEETRVSSKQIFVARADPQASTECESRSGTSSYDSSVNSDWDLGRRRDPESHATEACQAVTEVRRFHSSRPARYLGRVRDAFAQRDRIVPMRRKLTLAGLALLLAAFSVVVGHSRSAAKSALSVSSPKAPNAGAVSPTAAPSTRASAISVTKGACAMPYNKTEQGEIQWKPECF